MKLLLHFERPIQTIKAVSEACRISRFTLIQAAQRGDFGADVYKSGGTWLVDTTGQEFGRWLAAHASQPRVKGRVSLKQVTLTPPQDVLPQGPAKQGDILAVRLFDGSEALVQVCGRAATIGGTSKDFVRVDVLQPTGSYGKLWYISATGERRTPYEYSLPLLSDPTHGQNWQPRPLSTYRILTWEELQPLTIIPLYRDLDAKCGAEYTKHEYEADQGPFVAAKLFLRDAGYTIRLALKEKEHFQVTRSTDYEHFQVWMPEEHFGQACIWTCQEIVAEALRLLTRPSISEERGPERLNGTDESTNRSGGDVK